MGGFSRIARVRVRYFGHLRELAGKREEFIAMDGAAGLPDLLDEIARRHDKKFEEYAFERQNHLREGFVCAVNGDTISIDEFRELKCDVVKEFAILPPISGGK